jgi:hypothetical protein
VYRAVYWTIMIKLTSQTHLKAHTSYEAVSSYWLIYPGRRPLEKVNSTAVRLKLDEYTD